MSKVANVVGRLKEKTFVDFNGEYQGTFPFLKLKKII